MLGRCCHLCVLLLAVALAVPFFGPTFLKNPTVEIDVSASKEGQSVLVTGGSSGTGFEVSHLLAKRGAKVLVTGRTLERAQRSAPPGGSGLALDLTDFAAVRRFASEIIVRLEGSTLDVLILNAGMFYSEAYRGPYVSAAGQDTLVASNHLGHFLLVQELWPLIQRSNTRVVVVCSIAHWFAGPDGATFSDAPLQQDGEVLNQQQAMMVYATSKLMNVMFAYKLQHMFSTTGPTAVVCTPGFVKTSIGVNERGTGASQSWFDYAAPAIDGGKVLEAAVDANRSLLQGKVLQPYWIWEDAATSLPTSLRGVMVLLQELVLEKWTWGHRAHRSSPESYDTKLQDKMWAWSEGAVA